MPTGGNRTPLPAAAMRSAEMGSSLFTPGTPPAPEVQRQIRVLDYPAGYNLQWTPRSYESFSFAELRSFAGVELVRLAVETRKDQVERLGWNVAVKKNRQTTKRADSPERIRQAERFLRRPDGATDFGSWIRPLIEDLLVIDAPAVERRRNRGGGLIGLDVIDGATIRLLIDETGRRPIAPAPAFQQVIKGRVWADLTTDDLIYQPRNPRSNHLYGYSAVEQIVVTLNTALRRQAGQLAYFTEGNVPQGIISAPENWTPDQIKDFQEWFDSVLTGQADKKSRVLWTPFGGKYQPFKEAPLKDDFDEWLARIVCFAFSIPPTPFIKQMNRGTAQNDTDRAMEEGLAPLLVWVKRFFDGVIQYDLGLPELEFNWDLSEDLDPRIQSEVSDRNLRNGTITINEARAQIGLDPVAGGDKPHVYLAAELVPVEDVSTVAEQNQDMKQKIIDAPVKDPSASPPSAGKKDDK